ncbi:MAG: cytochrome c [Gammaproteobacteria bacterium]|jgi:cytochrome c553
MRTRTLFSGLVLLAATAALAPAHAAGDPAAGRIKSQTCQGCHGVPNYTNAYPTYRVPKIGGQNQQYLESALKEYRDGQRGFPTMQAQAASLSDQDIADIAAYFASLKDTSK